MNKQNQQTLSAINEARCEKCKKAFAPQLNLKDGWKELTIWVDVAGKKSGLKMPIKFKSSRQKACEDIIELLLKGLGQ